MEIMMALLFQIVFACTTILILLPFRMFTVVGLSEDLKTVLTFPVVVSLTVLFQVILQQILCAMLVINILFSIFSHKIISIFVF